MSKCIFISIIQEKRNKLKYSFNFENRSEYIINSAKTKFVALTRFVTRLTRVHPRVLVGFMLLDL